MFVDEVYISVSNAQDVANALQHFLNERDPNKYFKLEVEQPEGSHHTCLYVQPLDGQVIDLATGSQLVRCQADNHKRVDVIVPPTHRDMQPATVLLGDMRV